MFAVLMMIAVRMMIAVLMIACALKAEHKKFFWIGCSLTAF
jgi:hypothetical protein